MDACEGGFDDEEGDSDEGDAAEDVADGVAIVVVEAGKDDGEEAPGGGVIDGTRAEGDGAHGGSGEFLELDDASQHGEGGDAHGGAEEEHGLHQVGFLGEQFGVMVEVVSEGGAEDEGGDHAGCGDCDGAFEAFADDVDTELHSDDEHVEGEAELGGGEKVGLGVADFLGGIPGEDGLLEVGSEPAEEGGAEEDACDHFGDDLGLAHSSCDGADHPAEEEDDGDLKEEMDGQVKVVHRRSGIGPNRI